MSYFSRGFSSQRHWGVTQSSPNAFIPPLGFPGVFSGIPIASVTFTATATGSGRRTAGGTASVAFVATATGSGSRTVGVTAIVAFAAGAAGAMIQQGTVAAPSEEPVAAGNIFNMGQSQAFSSQW